MWWEDQACFINICTYLLFISRDKSHGGRGLVMLQKQRDKREGGEGVRERGRRAGSLVERIRNGDW